MIRTVQTTAYAYQKPGTSGLRTPLLWPAGGTL